MLLTLDLDVDVINNSERTRMQFIILCFLISLCVFHLIIITFYSKLIQDNNIPMIYYEKNATVLQGATAIDLENFPFANRRHGLKIRAA